MLVGRDLGPYRIEKEIGSGAMGTVYRATHRESGERVAVKLMMPALGSSDSAQARFVRELQILRQLGHANIVRYKGSGRFHGSPFFIMEYVEGESLDRVIARRNRLTWEEVVELGTQLCGALQHAHDKGIIHRDLKPSNVMVLRDGTTKLTDFGIAKDTDVTALTAANSTVGTAAYMSPEQCRGARDISFKSDLYSLGVMFYELLTGRKPFVAETSMEMFLKHANAPFTPPSKLVPEIPTWLNTLVCQLMEKKPEARPYSADKVAEALAMVKEKMTAQQSAGVDAAKRRRVDRTAGDAPMDETDKDAARALLGKKKKKKKELPFYSKGWFTIAALGLIGLLALTGLYVVFIKAPSPESLYASADAGRKADDVVSLKLARQDYLIPFLTNYPEHEKAATVRKWLDELDLTLAERPLMNRWGAQMSAVDDNEQAAQDALTNEDQGKVAEAARLWNSLLPLKQKTDPDVRGWGLVAEKHLKDFERMDAIIGDLRRDLQNEKILGEKEAEKLRPEWVARLGIDASDRPVYDAALDSMRAEIGGQPANAKLRWEGVRDLGKNSRERRFWTILAAKKVRELVEAK